MQSLYQHPSRNVFDLVLRRAIIGFCSSSHYKGRRNVVFIDNSIEVKDLVDVNRKKSLHASHINYIIVVKLFLSTEI